MNTSQYVEFGGLLVTVFSTLIIPFLERPFLGYSDIEIPEEYASSNNKKFSINVTNHGFETANGLVLSINASANKVNFINFTSNPSVPEDRISNNSSNIQVGHGILEIDQIPARQNFGIEGYVNSSNPNFTSDDLIPSLYSDETAGYSNGIVMITVNMILVFIIVAIVSIIYLIIEDRFPIVIFKLRTFKLKHSDKAIAINPNDDKAHYSKGNSLSKLERYEEAIVEYDKSIAINPNEADVYYNKGLSLSKLNRYEEAIVEYDKSIAINPNDDMVHYSKGNSLSKLNRDEEAIVEYDKSITINPNESNLGNKGLSLSKLNRDEEAIIEFDKAIAINPNNVDAQNNKKVSLSKLGL